MSLEAARASFRRELGLPGGRVIMTGHQCLFWHAGILAKYLACDRLSRITDVPAGGVMGALTSRGDHDTEVGGVGQGADFGGTGGIAAWLWVDQDTDETHTVRVPTRENGRLAVVDWRLHTPMGSGVPAACVPPFRPAPFVGEPALPSVLAGIGTIVNALNRHADKPNAARQTAAAVTELVSPLLKGPTPTAIFATDLMQTGLGTALIARMADNPRACAEHYNRAVFANPRADVANLALADGAGGVELPLWWLAPGAARRRVFARDLQNPAFDPRALAPRALLMTGMARMAACNLFIHGKGGALYDTITEEWFGTWLGVSLTPTKVVSADVLLPLAGADVTERDAALAAWRAHRARHDPALVGDSAGAAKKQALVQRIALRRAQGEHPVDDFRRMHQDLAAMRQRHEEQIRELDARAAEARRLIGERSIAGDRTWAFPFHSADALIALRRSTPLPS